MKYEHYTLISDKLFTKLSRLTGKALFVYILLRSKLRYRRGTMEPIDSVVTCTYKEAELIGVHSNAFDSGIKQLIERGLIEIEKRGKYGGRVPTEYRILQE